MIVFALDTALAAATAVVARDDDVLAVRCEAMARGHQEAIAVLAQEALSEAGVAVRDLERIGVVVGPGSFTGLRVGLAFAKGLAMAWRTPLVGVGALNALAASVSGQRVVAAIDAGRGQIYLDTFSGGADPQQLPIEGALHAIAAVRPDVIVGSAAGLLAQAAPDARLDHRTFADPVALARLTASAAEPSGAPKPLYLRAPDARTLVERGVSR